MMTEMLGKQIAVLVVLAGLYGVYSILMHVTARARRHRRNYRERMRLTEASRLHDENYGGYHPSDTAELVDKLIELESENQGLRGHIEKIRNEYLDVSHDTAARHEAEMNCLKSANKQCRNAVEALMPFLMEDYNGGIMSVDYKAAIELAIAVNDSQCKIPAGKA